MAKELKLTRLRIYPVKALEGMDADAWELDPYGLKYDRRWMVIDASGRCVTRLEQPTLASVQAEIRNEHLVLTAPHAPSVEVPLEPMPGPSEPATIGRDTIAVRDAFDDASRWLSEWLRAPVRLVFLPQGIHRSVDPGLGTRKAQLAFQDELPLQLLTRATLQEVDKHVSGGLSLEAARPSLFIEGPGAAHEEDTWRVIRVGDVDVQLVKPWPHAALAGESGAGLAGRRDASGAPCFGQLAITATTAGTLRVGATVKITERGDPPSFGAEAEAPGGETAPSSAAAEAPTAKGAGESKKVRILGLPTKGRKAVPADEEEEGPDPWAAVEAAAPGKPVEPEEPAKATKVPKPERPAQAAKAEAPVAPEEEVAAESSSPPAAASRAAEPTPESPPAPPEAPAAPAAAGSPPEPATRQPTPVAEPAEEAPVTVGTDRVPDAATLARLLVAAAVTESAGEAKRLAEACLGASVLITAWKGDALVGVLRGWTDGIRDGFISDVAVHPDHHATGAAQDLVRRAVALHPSIRWVLRASPGSGYLGSALGWQHAGSGWYLSPR